MKNLSKNKKDNEQENNNEKDSDDDEEYLSGMGHRSYQMRYFGLKNPHDNDGSANDQKRERINSIIEYNDKNDETSFLDNLNINELTNEQKKSNDNIQFIDSDIERRKTSSALMKENNDINSNIISPLKSRPTENIRKKEDNDIKFKDNRRRRRFQC